MTHSSTRKYIAILEIKNIRGKIFFQKNPAQLIREVDGETTPFKCPEQQLKRHTKKLQSLIQASKIDIPMKGLIVLAYSKTHVVLPPKYSTIVMGCDIHEYLDNYNKLPDCISIAKYNQLVNSLDLKSIEFIPKPIAQTFPLEISRIKTGLFCPNCCIKIKNQSKCPACKTPKIVMQRQAIEDWFYLVKDTISNNECVFFLELKDKFAANYILNKLKLHPVNHHKSRYYVLQKVSNIESSTH